MKIQYKIALTLIFLSSSISIIAQDVMFSQFYNTPLQINPAQAGSFDGAGRAGLSYRNQWASIMAHPFETFALEAELKLKEVSQNEQPLSFGIIVLRDKAGASKFSLTNAVLSIGYLQKLNNQNSLGAGIQGGYGQYSMDYTNLFWGNQYDPNSNSFDASQSSLEPNINNTYNHYNVAGGLCYTFQTDNYTKGLHEGIMFNMGAALSQSFIPKNSFYEASNTSAMMKYHIHADAHLGLPEMQLTFTPRFIFGAQGNIKQTIIGSHFTYAADKDAAAFCLGLYYRIGNAFIPYIGLDLKQFQLGFSFDTNTAKMNNLKNTNSLEVNLAYKFSDGKNKSSF